MEYIALVFSAMLISNIVLAQFLGICPFLGVSKDKKSALGMGLAVIFVVMVSSIITYCLNEYLLKPLELEYLQTLLFILVIASLVQFIEMFMKKYMVALYKSLGIFLPLITTNCVVLGVAKMNVANTFAQMIVFSFGTAVGYALVIYIFAAIRERLDTVSIPKPFKGVPIALITISILALAFMGFGGIF